jgi:hypothetical protein
MHWKGDRWVATAQYEDEGWVNEKQPELFLDKMRKIVDAE